MDQVEKMSSDSRLEYHYSSSLRFEKREAALHVSKLARLTSFYTGHSAELEGRIALLSQRIVYTDHPFLFRGPRHTHPVIVLGSDL